MNSFEEKVARFLAKLEDTLNDKYNRVKVEHQYTREGVKVMIQCDNLLDIYDIINHHNPYFIRTLFVR